MVITSLCGLAQSKGDLAAGINLGVAPLLESGPKHTNFGIGAKVQYNVSNPVRLEADLEYWFKDNGLDVFDIAANVHYILPIRSKLHVYPLAGIGYARVGRDDFSVNRFLFNLGAGAEYEITSNISAGFEIKYQFLKHYNRLPISIGATYHF